MTTQLIRVGHSPDPDDAFMFYALAHEKIDTGPYRYEHTLQDIETLNQRALRGELEVTAVSIHAYAYLADKYALMDCGSSMGDGYGPMLIAPKGMTLEGLQGVTVAVPGTMTTAFLGLRLALGAEFAYEVVPFDQIIEAVAQGRFGAGLIIHEGQLTYQNSGLECVLDLGVWWGQETGLPLPLGGNCVRRDLGDEAVQTITRHTRESIQYGLDHREDALEYALGYARDMGVDLADRFVGMYVNKWTIGYGERGHQAVRDLLARAHEAGIIPHPVNVEFVEGAAR
jgi:5,8-dihydroxy-2-naphthoate synthase